MRASRFRLALVLLCALSGCAGNDGTKHGSTAESPAASQPQPASAEQEDYEEKIDRLTAAIDSGNLSEKEMLGALVDRSYAHLQLQRLDEGLRDCNRALEINPRYSPCLVNRAFVAIRAGKLDSAFEDLERAIEFGKQGALSSYGFGVAYYTRAHAFFSRRDIDSAIADLERALVCQPKSSHIHLVHGYLMTIRLQWDRAREDYDRAIALAPNYAAAYVMRGAMFADRNDVSRANEDFAHAERLDPSVRSLRHNRALIWGS